MRRAAAALLVALACGRAEDAGPAADPGWAADPRLAQWLTGCAPRGPFDLDTSDTVALAVRVLESGQRDALPLARDELARDPARSLPALRRLVERLWSAPFGELGIANALDAAGMMAGGEGRELLARGLEHPGQLVRLSAARGLARNATPAERPALLALLDVSTVELWGPLLAALEHADPLRHRLSVARWIAEGERRPVWSFAAPTFAQCEPEVAEALAATWRAVPAEIRPWLAACRARAGDPEAEAWLQAELAAEVPARRMLAARAARAAGLDALLAEALAAPDAELRLVALEGVAALAPADEALAALRRALGDGSPDVRRLALAELVARGDDDATEHALAALSGGPLEREGALLALSRGFERDPALAGRAYEALRAALEARAGASPSAQAPLETLLGQVPDPRAAELLLARAERAAPDARERSGAMRDHRWLALHAGSSGPAGRALVRERWAVEPDPVRRLDLLEASLGDPELDGAFLLSVLEGGRASAWERLYASERLARLGPAERVLPLLKRVTLECDHPQVRPALDCLLWTLYGA